MTKSYLHLLNLDTVGGVEELFVHFLAHAHTLSSAQHHLLVTGLKPHPFFAKRLQSLAASITLEKFAFGCKMPSMFRPLQKKRAFTKSVPDKVILWNRLETVKSAHTVYYEHGASWIEKQTDHTRSFFNDVGELLANSHAAKRVLQLKWDVVQPIHVIENPLKPTLQARNGPKPFPKDRLKLGAIGRLIPLKGTALILHAIKALGDHVELIIAGDGSEKEKLMREIKKLNLQKHVTFLGCIQDVSSFYDTIDLLIVPSIREPLGLVAQEAALRGVPVISSAIDGLPEVVKNGETGYTISPTIALADYKEFGGTNDKLPDLVYDPVSDTLVTPRFVDPHHLASTIQSLQNDPLKYETFSQNAIAFAKSRPTIAHYTKALLDILFSPAI